VHSTAALLSSNEEMAMTTNIEDDTLGQALQKLESNLETPVVPGELTSWVSNLRESCDIVGRLLHDALTNSHEERFRQIQEQDPELSARVKQLRDEDEQLIHDFEAFARQVTDLDEKNLDRIANQPHADEHLAEMTECGLAFVIRARTQETALSTWHMEAFQRDRGLGD
jgi:hypothetical protein